MKRKTAFNFYMSYYFLVFFSLLLCFPVNVEAQNLPTEKHEVFRSTGLPLPRYVSLAHGVTNVRTGPGQQYPIKWVYKKKGMPVEIILEYDHWRKIRDYEGDEGWVYKSLLSGERTALIAGENVAFAYSHNPYTKPHKSTVSFQLEPLSLVDVEACEGQACYISISDLSGWISRKLLWGVYETENFD
ncbi:MAG: SH3 domain-containing protein [Alphaproteobacteria bacterium]